MEYYGVVYRPLGCWGSDWSTDWLTEGQIDWQRYWLADELAHPFTHSLTNWLTQQNAMSDLMMHILPWCVESQVFAKFLNTLLHLQKSIPGLILILVNLAFTCIWFFVLWYALILFSHLCPNLHMVLLEFSKWNMCNIF